MVHSASPRTQPAPPLSPSSSPFGIVSYGEGGAAHMLARPRASRHWRSDRQQDAAAIEQTELGDWVLTGQVAEPAIAPRSSRACMGMRAWGSKRDAAGTRWRTSRLLETDRPFRTICQ